jgi:hypothetical protein
MTIPTFIFGLVISTLLGAIFHIWHGGGIGKLALYLLLGWLGFWIGHYLAERLGFYLTSIGSLHLGPALGMGLLFLFVGHWLSLSEAKNNSTSRRY